jgi:RND family efflux transporter MFP subunit
METKKMNKHIQSIYQILRPAIKLVQDDIRSLKSKFDCMKIEYKELPNATRHKFLRFCIIVFLIALIGISYRIYQGIRLNINTQQLATLKVAVTTPLHGPINEELMMPGTVEAWHKAVIYARSPGFIETWYTDIGAHVKTGDLLALIDAPEIQAELLQAEANLATAEANNIIAQITDKRWKVLLKTDSVSQQEADEKAAAALEAEAIVRSNRANVQRLRNIVDYQSVVAPFDGIITARYIDVGSLINNGGGALDPALFEIVQSDKLRVYVRVPQFYATRLTKDMQVKLYFTEHPGKIYDAKLISTSEAINEPVRTLLAEFMMDNSNYEILPGSYVEAHFFMPVPDYLIRIPINSILFRAENLQVAIIDKDNKVKLKKITVQRDFGDELEIKSGLSIDDMIILNPMDSIFNGQAVEIVKHVKPKEHTKTEGMG